MQPSDDIIWQPTHLHQEHRDFDILLSRPFAREMLETTLTPETQQKMNEFGLNVLKRFKYNVSEPYRFHERTAFVRQIICNGSKGTWLELEGQYGGIPDLSKTKPLTYKTHNMDSSSDTLVLLCLFEQWIYYSQTLKEL